MEATSRGQGEGFVKEGLEEFGTTGSGVETVARVEPGVDSHFTEYDWSVP